MLKRRTLLRGLGLLLVAAPVARLGWLWSLNRPLNPVPEPDIRVVGNWVLDRRDLD